MQYDDPPPGPVRRHAGDWLETELLSEYLGTFTLAVAGALSLVTAGLAAWLGLGVAAGLGVGTLLGSAALWWRHGRRRQDLRKGQVAERQIGRAIEQALTASGCAVAHNVEGVSDGGDIDHLVATPRQVWVIETKYRRVPPGKFAGVLARIRENVDRVRALLPPDTPVQGCLILAYEREKVRRERGETLVYAHDAFRSEFLKNLARERGAPRATSAEAANVIWTLGRNEPVPQPAEASDEPKPSKADRPEGLKELRKRYPNAYEPWSAEDDNELRRLHGDGWTVSDLVRRFGRQPGAIRSRLGKLGLH